MLPLVDDGDAGLIVVNRVLQRFTDEALRSFARHRLDTNARGAGKANLRHAEIALKYLNQSLRLFALGFKFDARVNIL